MSGLDQALQGLLAKWQGRSGAPAILTHVRSGDGRIDVRGAAGAAPDTRFPIASVTKMFTAALIQQLCDEGRIALDDRIAAHLPDVDLAGLHRVKGVDQTPRLTVRHLLFQTSGLADYFEGGIADDLLAGRDRDYDLADVLAMARARRPMAPVGTTRAHYSDTNFQLLGAIIESVTGQSYDAAVKARICAPLGLTKTALYDPVRDTDTLPVCADGRPIAVGKALASMKADGGIVSDTDELLTFLMAFLRGELFDPAALPILQDWRPLSFPRSYGGGLMRFRLPGWLTLWRPTPTLVGHSGASGTFAYHAQEQDLYVAGTFNQMGETRRPFQFMQEAVQAIAAEAAR